MNIIALETSAKAVSAAITQSGRVLASGYQDTGLTHSRTLMPIVEHLFRNTGLTLQDMDAVAVSAGPGSFTGIRIGVSAAKGLAFAADKPAVGVSTLAAMARNVAFCDGVVVCAMDARRNQIYNALFLAQDGQLTRLTEDRAVALADLAEEKMKEINEAYDTITKMRSGGGASGGYQSQGAYRGSYQGGYQQQYSSASSGSLYNQVRQAINMGDIGRAEQLLRGAASQDAEWHFLTGSIAYRKGWLDEATQHFQMACNMDPANGEYRQALMMMRQGGQAYRPYGYGGGIDACDCCTACLCMNMCCGN